MIKLEKNTGSFRDPNGYVLEDSNGAIYRVVTEKGRANFEAGESSGLYETLIQSGRLIDYQHQPIESAELPVKSPAYLLSHPRIPFVSYPYEWSFEQLRQAALLQLDVYLDALKYNMTLSDATAYNIQFIGAQPVFIDLLSFRPYEDGMLWKGQTQFVEQFLNPLLLTANTGIPFNDMYRGHFSGIPSDALHAWLPKRSMLSFRYLNHVYLPLYFEKKQQRSASVSKQTIKGKLPKSGLEFLLKQLRKWIASLPNRHQTTTWSNYDEMRNYQDDEVKQKHAFIAEHIRKKAPNMVWDIGCNAGEFSASALDSGAAQVIGLEMDHGALDQAYGRSKENSLSFLPIYQNLLNPSACMGWNEQERTGLKTRAKADMVLALAVIHHLVIGGNIPLRSAVDYFMDLAPSGIIEWVPKSDGMIQAMLANREDIFADYNEEQFKACLSERADIVSSMRVSSTGRTLFFYNRAT